MHILKIFIHFFSLAIAFLLINEIYAATKQKHYFYDKNGILTIDGRVKGKSDLITLDMKVGKLNCNKRQNFVFSFCPDFNLYRRKQIACEEGLTFCYEPQLKTGNARSTYALETFNDLDVTKKCGDPFRGFKVGMRKMFPHEPPIKEIMVYEIQLSYMKESYFFPAPNDGCINIWFGNGKNLLTTVQTSDNDIIEPILVQDPRNKSNVLGAKDPMRDWMPQPDNFVRYREHPSLLMLYLDFKSQALVQQMMFTVGWSNTMCSLFGKVRSNQIGKCVSQFRQKSIALRSYGLGKSLTNYTLRIETGVETTETKGQKSVVSQLLDIAYEHEVEEESEETQRTELQEKDEEVVADNKRELYHHSSESKEVEDKTPTGKKAAAFLANWGIGAGCAVLSVVSIIGTGQHIGCEGGIEWKDTKTTEMHEAFTENALHKETVATSSLAVDTTQKAFQKAFSSTQGRSESTSKTVESSQSVSITKRTIFEWTVEVPKGKVLTPMQMVFDCDGNRVPIPWMKFVLTDEGESEAVIEDYAVENDEEAVGRGAKDPNNLGTVLKEMTEQEVDAENAFAKTGDLEEDRILGQVAEMDDDANGGKENNQQEEGDSQEQYVPDYSMFEDEKK